MTLELAERQGRLGNVAVARCQAELPDGIPYDKTNDALAGRPAIQGVR